VTIQFIHLDKQLKALSDSTYFPAPVFRSSNLKQDELASGLGRDIQHLLRYARLECPSIVEELNTPVTLSQRVDALIGYHGLIELGNLESPLLHRAKVITQLYFDLIYFRDRIMLLMKQIISQNAEMFGELLYLSEWLEIIGDNPFAEKIKALRNGFAHGKWAYLPDFSGLVCFPEHNSPYTRYEVQQDELHLMHGLLYGIQIVFFQVASQEFKE